MEKRERAKEEHDREQIKADVSSGEKNDTAYQSNPIRVKWVFYVPRERKNINEICEIKKRAGIPRFERICTPSVIF